MKLWDKMRKETAEAATEAAHEDVAIKLIKTGKLTPDEIAGVCKLTLQQVKDLADTIKQ